MLALPSFYHCDMTLTIISHHSRLRMHKRESESGTDFNYLLLLSDDCLKRYQNIHVSSVCVLSVQVLPTRNVRLVVSISDKKIFNLDPG